MGNFDNEFDKLFSKGLNKPTNIKPDSKDWVNLQYRLDSLAKPRIPWVWALIPLLLLPLLWMGYQIWDLKKEIAAMHLKTTNSNKNITIIDTSYQKHYIFDTVYSTTYMALSLPQNDYLAYSSTPKTSTHMTYLVNPIMSSKIDKNSKNDNAKPLKTNDINSIDHQVDAPDLDKIVNNDKKPVDEKVIIKKDEHTIIDPKSSIIEFNSIDSINKTNNSPIDENKNLTSVHHSELTERLSEENKDFDRNKPSKSENPKNSENNSLTKKNTIFQSISEVFEKNILENEPPHWRFGLALGTGKPFGIKDFKIDKSIYANIYAEWIFGSKFSILPTIGFVSYDGKLERTFNNRLQLPAPILPGSNYEYKYVEGFMKHFVPSLLFRYRVKSNEDLSGFFGLGPAARLSLKSTFEYEFIQNNTGTQSKYYEAKVISPNYSIVRFNSGLGYNFNSKLSLFTDFDLFVDYGKAPRHLSYFGGLLGIRYIIK